MDTNDPIKEIREKQNRDDLVLLVQTIIIFVTVCTVTLIYLWAKGYLIGAL